MPVKEFPDPRTASTDGLVAVGGDLHPDTLVLAYRNGIFPWPAPGLPLLWFSPPERGILDFGALHLPRSLRAAQRRSSLRFTVDTAFAAVVRACAQAARPGQDGTWITAQIDAAYVRLHGLGIAHSVEAWNRERLVGGIYGVGIDGVFAAESMFYKEPNASKLALLHLVDHLRGRGLDWLDIQVLTPHLEKLGAYCIPREQFLQRLKATRARRLQLF